ncbi:hypothetical protein [Thalassospira alkalitolerans]|uniref:hypothetical protein n=1 Tax=Thalassospira alkalitolerans TaxID=1293890 RepID=UPI003AA8D2C1
MSDPILTEANRRDFIDTADTMINADISAARIRLALADKFGLSMKQVQNMMNRVGLRTGEQPAPQNKIKDLSDARIIRLVSSVKDMMADGVDPLMIKAKMRVAYDIRENDVTVICKRHGVILTGKVNPKARECGDDTVEDISIEKADIGIEGNLFAIAAQRVAGGRYDRATGNCFIGNCPVSGLTLVREARMEFPV